MKIIKLTQNKECIVDDDMFEELNKYKWFYNTGYAVRNDYPYGKRKTIRMHRIVNNTTDGFDTDHINGNKLDNRRSNLRTATHKQNMANQVKPKNNTSGFKGVYWHKLANKWQARIQFNNKRIHLGLFDDIKEAVSAYNDKAVELFGEFAKINE